jgi:hypothetical protein
MRTSRRKASWSCRPLWSGRCGGSPARLDPWPRRGRCGGLASVTDASPVSSALGVGVTAQLQFTGGEAGGAFMTWLSHAIRANDGDPQIVSRKVAFR